jgi:2-phospho-L-lactate guanylyltransferase
MAEIRGLCALVPVKDPAQGKSRLASLLDADERRDLNLFLARQAIEACSACFGPLQTIVVTASAAIAKIATDAGVHALIEGKRAAGLNAALAMAADSAIAMGARGIVVVPTDLALPSTHALRAALAVMPAAPGCLIAPDRRNAGTNLLALAPARSDLFSFGAFSVRRHEEAARRLGYDVHIHRSAALALDLDLPEDYVVWRRDRLLPPTNPRQASLPVKILRA